MSSERGLQFEGSCTTIKSFNTTYNSDDRVPTYTGVMFEIFPRVDMEMLTFEMDVRIPTTVIDPDLSVEVYTMQDSYLVMEAYDEAPWSLVADTRGVLLPNGKGLIIPMTDFIAVQLTAGRRQSFYVTMKESYIDHNVMALQKSGEVQVNAGDFDLMVGVGFTEYKFPGDFDKTVDPQFSGVFHFKTSQDCLKAVETTSVDFSFLLKQEVTPLLTVKVNDFMNDIINELMVTNSVLKNYQKYFGLQQHGNTQTSATSFEGNCPEDWNPCPSFFLTSTFTFVHRDNLGGGQLKYEVYLLIESIVNVLQSRLAVPETDLIYVGLESVSANLRLSVANVPNGRIMTDAEQIYFSDVLTDFIQEETAGSFIAVYEVDIVEQSFQESSVRRRLQGETGQLILNAKIRGAQSTFLSVGSYRNQLENVFRLGEAKFLENLQLNKNYPTELGFEGGSDYFDAVNDIGGTVVVDEVASSTVVQTEAKDNSHIAMATGMAAAGLVLIALLLFLRRHFERSAENKVDKQNMKELRKEREKADRKEWAAKLRGSRGSGGTLESSDSGSEEQAKRTESKESKPAKLVKEENPDIAETPSKGKDKKAGETSEQPSQLSSTEGKVKDVAKKSGTEDDIACLPVPSSARKASFRKVKSFDDAQTSKTSSNVDSPRPVRQSKRSNSDLNFGSPRKPAPKRAPSTPVTPSTKFNIGNYAGMTASPRRKEMSTSYGSVAKSEESGLNKLLGRGRETPRSTKSKMARGSSSSVSRSPRRKAPQRSVSGSIDSKGDSNMLKSNTPRRRAPPNTQSGPLMSLQDAKKEAPVLSPAKNRKKLQTSVSLPVDEGRASRPVPRSPKRKMLYKHPSGPISSRASSPLPVRKMPAKAISGAIDPNSPSTKVKRKTLLRPSSFDEGKREVEPVKTRARSKSLDDSRTAPAGGAGDSPRRQKRPVKP